MKLSIIFVAAAGMAVLAAPHNTKRAEDVDKTWWKRHDLGKQAENVDKTWWKTYDPGKRGEDVDKTWWKRDDVKE
ncbi:hypothetical protein OIDMADRAFT_58528 [Oidiodendron maius Zn]|uniref:Uncharacterized protein n=1 Tax=Oidiodendron maius (strain Zn) TaxID=913774 RepID=A0A0C3CDF8_OIDMZ|nr:hypothetical protein OIDMADRAFT_58528 [Oidiodendron maius Zn]